MNSTLPSSSHHSPIDTSAEHPRPILSINAPIKLTWFDRLSHALPLLLVGLPLGLTVTIVAALTPAETTHLLFGESSLKWESSPDQMTSMVDAQP